jgi:ferritin-like metal-binding protein YciE
MSKIESFEELFLEQISDLYDAEHQMVAALPKMLKVTTNSKLADAFSGHLIETKNHVKRLEDVFATCDVKAKRKPCKAMKGLVEEGSEAIELESHNPAIVDAALIAAAQRVEHYEIAAYGTARAFAELLGNSKAVDLLQATLDEEGEADKTLTSVSETVNEQASQTPVPVLKK